MKILAIEKELPQTAPVDFAPHLAAEAARAWELYQAGLIRELYFRQDRHEAVLVLECANLAEAEQLLATLPLVQAGLITFELIPLVAYPGFARLFAG
jgi:muconolactone delta-isomerase